MASVRGVSSREPFRRVSLGSFSLFSVSPFNGGGLQFVTCPRTFVETIQQRVGCLPADEFGKLMPIVALSLARGVFREMGCAEN